jgi:LysR family glycine cleavage system transcriptional activator
MRRAPSLSAIEAFLAVAECGGMRRAADNLCLSASAVTRRVQALERHAGAALFDRSSGRLTLTTAGSELRQRLQAAVQGLRTALAADDEAPVRLRISRSVAGLWLAPRLSRAPLSVAVQLCADLTPSDLRKGAADLGVFYGGAAEGLDVQALLPIKLSVVSAPRLADGRLAPSAPADLSAFARLDLAGHEGLWRRHAPASHRALTFDGIQVLYEAAASGLGLAHGLHPLVEPYLASGRLVELPWIERSAAGAYALVAAPNALRSQRVCALCDWLAEEMAAPN